MHHAPTSITFAWLPCGLKSLLFLSKNIHNAQTAPTIKCPLSTAGQKYEGTISTIALSLCMSLNLQAALLGASGASDKAVTASCRQWAIPSTAMAPSAHSEMGAGLRTNACSGATQPMASHERIVPFAANTLVVASTAPCAKSIRRSEAVTGPSRSLEPERM